MKAKPNPKKRVHFAPQYFLTPPHPITINLVGAGGTGSQVASCLARMDVSLVALGHPGLHVRIFDPDTVSAANQGRQLFSLSEVGLNKAVCLTTRINRFFGSAWKAIPERYDMKKHSTANIFITCVDNIKSRVELGEELCKSRRNSFLRNIDYNSPLYWLDFGNGRSMGQAVLGTIQSHNPQPKSQKYKTVDYLPPVTEMFDYSTIDETDSGPSCSLAEALEKQDLFINSTLANLGCDLLWKLFHEGMIEHRGLFLNLETMRVNPIGV